jgi:hypothetical protein
MQNQWLSKNFNLIFCSKVFEHPRLTPSFPQNPYPLCPFLSSTQPSAETTFAPPSTLLSHLISAPLSHQPSAHSPRINQGKLSLEQCDGGPDALAREWSEGTRLQVQKGTGGKSTAIHRARVRRKQWRSSIGPL